MTKPKFQMINMHKSVASKQNESFSCFSLWREHPSSKVSYFNRRSVIITPLKTKESRSQPIVLCPFFTHLLFIITFWRTIWILIYRKKSVWKLQRPYWDGRSMLVIADKRAVSLHVKSLNHYAFTPATDGRYHNGTNSNSETYRVLRTCHLLSVTISLSLLAW